MTRPPRILAIAGSDSSGGAGIQADIKTITMLGGYAMTAITAVTAQDTTGVHGIEALSPAMVGAQIDACTGDIGVDAVKIGMLGSADIAHLVADRLEALDVPVVFDPVMVATSGAALADDATIAAFERLMALATLTTPNVPELERLVGREINGDEDSLAKASEYLMKQTGARAVLAKGGHWPGGEIRDARGLRRSTDNVIFDCLFARSGEGYWSEWTFDHPRIETRHNHGTGCTLSSAVATFLGMGSDLPGAVSKAGDFVNLALRDAPGFGAGHGPLGHAAVRLDLTGEPRLNQITVPALDYAASVAFYRKLGLVQIVDSPANGYARFESPGGATLSVHCGETGGGAAVYFECLDLDAMLERLAAKGIEFTEPVHQSWLWLEAWAEDPAGNRICLYQAGIARRYPPWALDR
ncbi:MAG: bifunctional hydroxymethylpyrimidine kinase/phosphomethylpyrimidine kinase [Novosphingobium sp.]|nr:bifunctional hydroxymethylpyrimidine kinase/phosphomethylpyrimidine kinase [Novosphingobium sp.]